MPEQQFVGFEVAPSDTVSPCWRVLPLLAYLLVIPASLAGSVAVGTTVARFHDQCPLYARPSVATFDGQNVTLNERASDTLRSSWGSTYVCSLAEFMPIFAVIFSAAFFFFFCMCGKGGKGSAEGFGMDSPWRIVCPGLVFNLGMTIATLVCAIWTSGGVYQFCLGLESHANISCLNLNNYNFVDYPKISSLRSWFVLAQVCVWLMFSGLLFVTLLLALRCVCRPDLRALYETLPTDTVDERRPSTDTFVTAASTPRRPDGPGPGGDGATPAGPPVTEAVSPLIHHSSDA